MPEANPPVSYPYAVQMPQRNITDIIEKASESEDFIRNLIEINTRGRDGIDFIWKEINQTQRDALTDIDLFDLKEILDPATETPRYFKRFYRRTDWKPSIEDNNLAIWLEEKLRFILNPSTLIRNTKDVNRELCNIMVSLDGELFLLKTNPNPKRRISLDGPSFVRITDAIDTILTSVYMGTTTSSAHISNKEATISMNQVSTLKTLTTTNQTPEKKNLAGAIADFLPGPKEVLQK